MPGVGPKKGPEKNAPALETTFVDYTGLPAPERRMFVRRFKESYGLFNPYGEPGSIQDAFPPFLKGDPKSKQVDPRKKGKMDGKDDDEEDEAGPFAQARKESKGPVLSAPVSTFEAPEWCLVRFIDADVEPGKTYLYAVQVRVYNPNYDKPEVVAFEKLAKIKELFSDWTLMPPITIPPEWDFYAVDEFVIHPEAQKQPAKGADIRPTYAHPERVAVQIHKWVKDFLDRNVDDTTTQDEGDWVILERLLVHRGEAIAKKKVAVELPEWVKARDHFELVGLGPTAKFGRKADKNAITIDFDPPSGAAPLAVDFVGGAKYGYQLAGRSTMYDDSAVELLVLSADGKLQLRTSRADGDPDMPRGLRRKRQYDHWEGRLQGLHPNSSWRSFGGSGKR